MDAIKLLLLLVNNATKTLFLKENLAPLFFASIRQLSTGCGYHLLLTLAEQAIHMTLNSLEALSFACNALTFNLHQMSYITPQTTKDLGLLLLMMIIIMKRMQRIW